MGNGLVISGLSTSFNLDSSNFDAATSTLMGLGASVSKGATTLPATTTANLFTITGGRILMTGIVGEVTTVVQTQACNLSISSDPTVAGTSVALCGVLNISADTVGTLYSITGTVSDAMVDGLAVRGMTMPLIIQAGAIVWTTSATNTGAVSWKMWYQPLDSGVVVAAA